MARKKTHYPWHLWFNGFKVWRLKRGEDYFISDWQFHEYARRVANDRGLAVKFKVSNDSVHITCVGKKTKKRRKKLSKAEMTTEKSPGVEALERASRSYQRGPGGREKALAALVAAEAAHGKQDPVEGEKDVVVDAPKYPWVHGPDRAFRFGHDKVPTLKIERFGKIWFWTVESKLRIKTKNAAQAAVERAETDLAEAQVLRRQLKIWQDGSARQLADYLKLLKKGTKLDKKLVETQIALSMARAKIGAAICKAHDQDQEILRLKAHQLETTKAWRGLEQDYLETKRLLNKMRLKLKKSQAKARAEK